MTNQSTTTKEALEPPDRIWIDPNDQSFWNDSQDVLGLVEYSCASRHYFCSCGGALTAEEYIEHYFEKGHDRGDPAFTPAPIVAPVVDYARLAEWLDMLVTALKASQKYDYNEWGQFIMGAENWADRLRAAFLPAEPRDYCEGASCADCVRSDCTCPHHVAPASPAALRDEARPLTGLQEAYNQGVEDAKCAIRAESQGGGYWAATYINAIARRCSPFRYTGLPTDADNDDRERMVNEAGLVDEVQHRMDQVVEAAVEWHQAGQEGGEWLAAADKLGAAINSLLEIRGTPSNECFCGTELAAEEIADRWMRRDLPLKAAIHSNPRLQLQELATRIIERYFFEQTK